MNSNHIIDVKIFKTTNDWTVASKWRKIQMIEEDKEK